MARDYKGLSNYGSNAVLDCQRISICEEGRRNAENPSQITENKPRKPIFGGVLFFLMAAVLGAFGLYLLWNYVSLYL